MEFLRADLLVLTRGRLVLFWSLLFPALMLVMQMTMFGGGATLGPVDVCLNDGDHSEMSGQYLAFLEAGFVRQQAVKIRFSRLSSGTSDSCNVVINVLPGFEKAIKETGAGKVEWRAKLRDDPAIAAISGITRGLTDAYNLQATKQTPKISLTFVKPDTSAPVVTYSLYLTTGLCGMIVLSTSLLGFATVLVAAREGGLFRLYHLFPVNRSIVLLAWIVSRLIITIGSSLVMFLIAWWIYGVTIQLDYQRLLLAIFILGLGNIAFLAIGLLIASYSSSVSVASMLANMVYFPLLFIGNLMIPVSRLPMEAQQLLDRLPLNAMVSSMRRLLVEGKGFDQEVYTLVILTAVALISMTIGSKRFTWISRD